MTKFYFLLFTVILVANIPSKAQQSLSQYFDDTATNNSIKIILDTASTNTWQIGPPQKTIFDSAATAPNALVTDTINNYPPNNTSSFSFSYVEKMGYDIIAFRWKQKIDFVDTVDGGVIEFSKDTGKTWQNVMDNPYVYNFYGFDTSNIDTISTGELAFTGLDTLWRDIWLCFDRSLFNSYDSVLFRFTLKSDTVDTGAHEGWLIDNFMIQQTYIHTVKKTEAAKYMTVYPTATTGRVYIEAEKLHEYHVIEKIELVNMAGRVVQEHGLAPTKFFIDIGQQPAGEYFLKIKTNKKLETFRIFLNK